MVNIEISRMSSKGQVVIPKNMRKSFKEGEDIIFIEEGGKIILKNKDSLSKTFKEDLEFAKKTEEAYLRIQNGEGIEMDFEDFISHLKKKI